MSRRLDLRRSGPWIGLVGLVAVLWLYGASALVVPLWAVAALVLAWLVQLVLAIRWFHKRPYVVLLLPVAALVLWVAVVAAGAAWLGWSA